MPSDLLRRPALVCAHCREAFVLPQWKPRFSIKRLPDPFSAVCPHCHQEASYAKSAISILAAVPGAVRL